MYKQHTHKRHHSLTVSTQICMCTEEMIWDLKDLGPSAAGDRKKQERIRRGSFAPALRSPGGRLACSVSPLSRPQPAGPRFGRCCPCCPVKYNCRLTERFNVKTSAVMLCPPEQMEIQNVEKFECILTPYHREHNRAHIRSSRMTRCHDTSSPVECWEKPNLTGLWLKSCHSRGIRPP